MADPSIRSCRIPALLERKGKQQVDLANHLNVTEAHISRVIKLQSLLSLPKLRKTARYFGCNMDDIYEWSE